MWIFLWTWSAVIQLLQGNGFNGFRWNIINVLVYCVGGHWNITYVKKYGNRPTSVHYINKAYFNILFGSEYIMYIIVNGYHIMKRAVIVFRCWNWKYFVGIHSWIWNFLFVCLFNRSLRPETHLKNEIKMKLMKSYWRTEPSGRGGLT